MAIGNWQSRALIRVCSPSGGAVRRSRTERAAGSSVAFLDPFAGIPLRPAAEAAVHLPHFVGEDTWRGNCLPTEGAAIPSLCQPLHTVGYEAYVSIMSEHNNSQIDRARAMRRDPTWSELRLWEVLRRGQLGVRFRRQHPVGPYIVDFVALQPGLVVEVDGASHHSESPRNRERRDSYLRSNRLAVLHFSDDDVRKRLDSVLFVIRATLEDSNEQWEHERDPW